MVSMLKLARLGGQDRPVLSFAKELQSDALDLLPPRGQAQRPQRVENEDRLTVQGLGVAEALVEPDGDIGDVETDGSRDRPSRTPSGFRRVR